MIPSTFSLKSLSNHLLHETLLKLTHEERRLTLEILHHLKEVETRRLFAERGHSSLFEYCVTELKYSESAAQRRISAMRALRSLPELSEKVENGELKLTQLSCVQSFIRAEEKSGKPYTLTEKRALFQSMSGKSARETERILALKSPESFSTHRERVQVLNETHSRLTLTLDEKILQELNLIRDRFAHELPRGASLSDVIAFMAKRTLASALENRPGRAERSCSREKLEQTQKQNPEKNPDPDPKTKNLHSDSLAALKTKTTSESKLTARALPAPEVHQRSRYIPASVRRFVFKRDQGMCQFVSSTTQKPCHSRHRVQVDHFPAYALGGDSRDPKKLRLLCFTHNQFEARRVFGERKTNRGAKDKQGQRKLR